MGNLSGLNDSGKKLEREIVGGHPPLFVKFILSNANVVNSLG